MALSKTLTAAAAYAALLTLAAGQIPDEGVASFEPSQRRPVAIPVVRDGQTHKAEWSMGPEMSYEPERSYEPEINDEPEMSDEPGISNEPMI